MSRAGRFEQATRLLEQAVALEPERANSWFDLVHTKRVTEAERSWIDRMTDALKSPPRTDAERSLLHFSLGKALDDLGEYDAAFQHFEMGNRIEHRANPFDRAAFAGAVDIIISTFTSEFFAQHAGFSVDSDLPLLILGMPRSGTTLVEQIISAHPAVSGAGELPFWTEKAQALFHTWAGPHKQEWVRSLAEEYLTLLRRLAPHAARITDKTPVNFFWIGLIYLALSRPRIIHCQRHPLDTCLSIYFTHFAGLHDFAYDRGDLVFYYRQYERLMAHWRTVLPQDCFFEIQYEMLVADREALTRQLVAFCGLEWSEACLSPERNKRVVTTASVWQARQPIYTSSVARWRHYEPWLGELHDLIV
jgi:tetratricopeptide (TPR) repeat protein